MTKQDVIEIIKKQKIIVIVRGVAKEKLIPLCEAMERGGIRLVEITFDAKGKTTASETAKMIRMLCEHFGARMCFGAGTVLNAKQAKLAAEAGAKYLISPNIPESVIRFSVANDLVSIPGAMTPTEIVNAYELGADFVKIFPSDSLGLSYIKAIRAPLSHIPMLAVGGVNEGNIRDFFAAGVDGIGVGSAIVNKSLIESGDFDAVTEMAKRYVSAIGD